MKLIFWNVQRVGEGSDPDKLRCIDLVIQYQLKPMPLLDEEDEYEGRLGGEVDGIVLCEITSDACYGEYHIAKIGAVSRRGRKATAQLGYGGVMWDGSAIVLDEEAIDHHNTVFGLNFHLHGGNSFTAHAKRKVMRLRGTNIFVYHSNASYKSKHLVHWVAGHLKLKYTNYVLIGDLNCQPSELDGVIREYDNYYATNNVFAPGAYRASYTLQYDSPTHHVHHGLGSTLDWAVLGGTAVGCQVDALNSPDFIEGVEPHIVSSHPDHLPILLTTT